MFTIVLIDDVTERTPEYSELVQIAKQMFMVQEPHFKYEGTTLIAELTSS